MKDINERHTRYTIEWFAGGWHLKDHEQGTCTMGMTIGEIKAYIKHIGISTLDVTIMN